MEQSWAGDGLGVGGGYSLLYWVFKVSGGRAGGIPVRGSLRAARGRPRECPLGIGRAGGPWVIWAEPNPDVLCQPRMEIRAPTLPRGAGSCQDHDPNPPAKIVFCLKITSFGTPTLLLPLPWPNGRVRILGDAWGRFQQLRVGSGGPAGQRTPRPGRGTCSAGRPGLGSCYLSAEGPRGCRSSGYPGRGWQCPAWAARSPPVSPRPRRQLGPGGCGSRLGSGLGEGAGGWNEGEVGGQGGWRPSPWQRGGLFSIRREGQGPWVQGDASPSLRRFPGGSDQVSPKGATAVTSVPPGEIWGVPGTGWAAAASVTALGETGSALPWVPPLPTVSWATVPSP